MPDPHRPDPAPTLEQRLREAAAQAETDLRRVIQYVNDEVVPDVRRHSSNALRAAALEFDRLARQMESARGNVDARGASEPRTPPPPPRPPEA